MRLHAHCFPPAYFWERVHWAHEYDQSLARLVRQLPCLALGQGSLGGSFLAGADAAGRFNECVYVRLGIAHEPAYLAEVWSFALHAPDAHGRGLNAQNFGDLIGVK